MSSNNSSWPSWRVGALVGAGAAVALGLAYVSGTYSRPAKKDNTNTNAEKTEKTEGSSKPKRTEAKTGVKTDEFATVAKEYVKFRPRYPAEIVQDLIAYYDANAKLPRSQALAVDVGTGSGQIAVPLAGHGFKVIGLDKSAAQLSQATAAPNVEYKVGSDTNTGVADGAASLVTVAQAAHWFDLPAFYKETKRILGPNGVMSIMGYAVCSISEPAEAQPIFAAYYERLNDYWPKDCDRDLLDSGFAAAQFPFDNVQRKWYPQRTTLRFQDFMGYLRTWSGLVQYKKEHPNPDDDPSVELERDLLSLDSISGPEAEIVITYPFFMINCTKPE